MVSGMLTLLTLAAGIAGPMTGPDKAAQRYRVDVEITQELDLTAAGQGVQVASVTGTAFLNLSMSDTAGGKLAHVVIDSLTVSATGQLAMAFTQTLADELRGAWLHGYVVDGKLNGPAKPSVEGNAAMGIALAGMNALFPGVTSKATAAGASWADTTHSSITNESGTQNTDQVVTWTVRAKNGATMTLTSSGMGTANADMEGQQITGTVTSSGDVTSQAGGPSTSAIITLLQELSVLTPSLPDPIPVKVSSTAKLVELP
jgi:hypothetical protein